MDQRSKIEEKLSVRERLMRRLYLKYVEEYVPEGG